MIFGHDADIVAPDMPVGFDDAADVGLHRGALQRAARLGFDHGRKVLVLDLLVAFEGDAVEHRRFGQMHDQPFAGAIDRNLVEQAGCDQRLQRRIARGVVKPPVGRGVKIRTHRLGIDAAIALDHDGSRDDGAVSAASRRRRHQPEHARQASSRQRRDRGDRLRCVMRSIFTSLPVSHLTGCDRIARAGQKNV